MISSGTIAWQNVPTALDELWCPLVEFASGCAEGDLSLLIEGAPKGADLSEYHLLTFSRVYAVMGFAESLYCTAIRPAGPSRSPTPVSKLQKTGASAALDEILVLAPGPLTHFRILSGGMHCEVVAHPEYSLKRYVTREAAVEAGRRSTTAKTTNLDAQDPATIELMRSLAKGAKQ